MQKHSTLQPKRFRVEIMGKPSEQVFLLIPQTKNLVKTIKGNAELFSPNVLKSQMQGF